MVNPHRNRPLTNAVLDAVRTALPDIPIGDGDRPEQIDDQNGWQGEPGVSAFTPWAVIDALPGGIGPGDLVNPNADAEVLYGIRAVGPNREVAELVGDLVRTALLSATLTIVGGEREVTLINLDQYGSSNEDDEIDPKVWVYAGDRVRITTTSTGA